MDRKSGYFGSVLEMFEAPAYGIMLYQGQVMSCSTFFSLVLESRYFASGYGEKDSYRRMKTFIRAAKAGHAAERQSRFDVLEKLQVIVVISPILLSLGLQLAYFALSTVVMLVLTVIVMDALETGLIVPHQCYSLS